MFCLSESVLVHLMLWSSVLSTFLQNGIIPCFIVERSSFVFYTTTLSVYQMTTKMGPQLGVCDHAAETRVQLCVCSCDHARVCSSLCAMWPCCRDIGVQLCVLLWPCCRDTGVQFSLGAIVTGLPLTYSQSYITGLYGRSFFKFLE